MNRTELLAEVSDGLRKPSYIAQYELDTYRAEAAADFASRNKNRHAASPNTRGWRMTVDGIVFPHLLSPKDISFTTFSDVAAVRIITPTGWRVCPKTFSLMKGR